MASCSPLSFHVRSVPECLFLSPHVSFLPSPLLPSLASLLVSSQSLLRIPGQHTLEFTGLPGCNAFGLAKSSQEPFV
jgi:hypothetical protein